MTDTSDIRKAVLAGIDEVIEQETFSATALAGIQKMREDVEELTRAVGAAEETIKRKDETIDRHSATIADLQDEIGRLVRREEAVAAKEEELANNERHTANIQGKLDGFREMATLVFRNTEVRREVVKNVNNSGQSESGYYRNDNESTTETTTETEG